MRTSGRFLELCKNIFLSPDLRISLNLAYNSRGNSNFFGTIVSNVWWLKGGTQVSLFRVPSSCLVTINTGRFSICLTQDRVFLEEVPLQNHTEKKWQNNPSHLEPNTNKDSCWETSFLSYKGCQVSLNSSFPMISHTDGAKRSLQFTNLPSCLHRSKNPEMLVLQTWGNSLSLELRQRSTTFAFTVRGVCVGVWGGGREHFLSSTLKEKGGCRIL